MEDDQNGRRPKWKTTKWKTTKMEDDQNGRRPKWKTTKMEDDQNGRQLKCKYASIQVCKYESMQVCLNCAICKVRGKLIVCSLCDIFLRFESNSTEILGFKIET